MLVNRTSLAIAGLLAIAAATAWTTLSPAADERYVLAASWQPGFCETQPDKPECRSQGHRTFDASNFTLHGLWPQRAEFCGVSGADIEADKSGRWSSLPPVDLSPALRRKLDEAMPGTRSSLDRHEWTKHGTCSGQDQETYYTNALRALDAVNQSAVGKLFADNVGRRLSQEEVRAAFDQAFGPGAGERVRLSCKRDGNRRLITEITIGLSGAVTADADIARLIAASPPTDGGCDGGIVDPIGFQ